MSALNPITSLTNQLQAKELGGQYPTMSLSEIIKMYASVTSPQGVKDIPPVSVTDGKSLTACHSQDDA